MPLHFIHPVHRATHRIGLYVDELSEQQLTQGEAHILALLAESSPATVADVLSRQIAESSTNYLVGQFAFGDLSLEEMLRSVKLFAAEVMPACIAAADAPARAAG